MKKWKLLVIKKYIQWGRLEEIISTLLLIKKDFIKPKLESNWGIAMRF